MKIPDDLETERLLLRRWRPSDVESFAAINADPKVMEFFPYPLNLDETKNFVTAIEMHFDREGFGLWAVDLKSNDEFIGFVGLSRPNFEAHFTPCVEVGWRLARDHWGNGYAPEAALEALRDGFERAELEEIISMTSRLNKKSMRVMEKIGMRRDPQDDFEHPSLPKGHHLRLHVLYRLSRDAWLQH